MGLGTRDAGNYNKTGQGGLNMQLKIIDATHARIETLPNIRLFFREEAEADLENTVLGM